MWDLSGHRSFHERLAPQILPQLDIVLMVYNGAVPSSLSSLLQYYAPRAKREEWINKRSRVAVVANMEHGADAHVEIGDGQEAAAKVSEILGIKCGFMLADSSSAITSIELFEGIADAIASRKLKALVKHLAKNKAPAKQVGREFLSPVFHRHRHRHPLHNTITHSPSRSSAR